MGELANGALGFSSITFSSDGKLMAAVAGGWLYLLDAFSGAVKARFSTGVPPGSGGCEASFTPDGQYISTGVCTHVRPDVIDPRLQPVRPGRNLCDLLSIGQPQGARTEPFGYGARSAFRRWRHGMGMLTSPWR